MTDAALLALAHEAGLHSAWRDAFGKEHQVTPDTLRAVLKALDLPAGSEAEIADSRAQLLELDKESLPPLVTATAGQPVRLPIAAGRFRLTREDGSTLEGEAEDDDNRALIPGIEETGYHHLSFRDGQTTIAVAPARCFNLADAGAPRAWGLAVQLYALSREGDGGIGDFAALTEFVRNAARHGASACAISPVHAQFSADPDRFSPYAPSSRALLNVVHAPTDIPGPESGGLIDWPALTRARLAALRARFDRLDPALAAYRREQGDVLELHARFEALHAHLYGADLGRWHWRSWPEQYRDPRSPAVAEFARERAEEIAFHAWLQFQADQGLCNAQAAARAAGMRIGLISDLAVGTDSGGSHGWSRQDEMLIGLSVGAPPDLLSPQGQDWGLVAFSPRGLRLNGYSAFLEMLRAALRHAGGVRIDHAMGLTRLWMLPEGAAASEGAYLRLPQNDLLRLLALESTRHRAIVLGEDLGTVPEGFQQSLQDADMLGMRVLWFERKEDASFVPPCDWTPKAVGMTSTHDLPTLAGWWRGHDLDVRASLGFMRDEHTERTQRERDRGALWRMFRDSGATAVDPPPLEDTAPFVDAAITHVGTAACDLVLLPVEDALGLTEQPNLPGTLHEHPNWRRRLPEPADRVLDQPEVAARLARLDRARAG